MRVVGLLRLRCPICRTGRIFSGQFAMNEQCPQCRYVFEREPGYFLGAMVIGYALALPLVAGLALVVHVAEPWLTWERAFFVGFVFYLALVPAVFRYSRTIWIYIDNWLDPPEG
jgi:uncharacterized protein (DUF983 family)